MATTTGGECFFRPCGEDQATKPVTAAGPRRIKSIIEASKCREDGIHINLEQELKANDKLTIQCHRDCVSTYTSKCHIRRHLKRLREEEDVEPTVPAKRFCRSSSHKFSFKEQCVFCGDLCIMNHDPKHPNRWRRVVLCRTADRGGKETFKQAILNVCDERNDEWASHVKIRIQGAVSDLHAADAQYHEDCKSKFMAPRSVRAAASSTQPKETEDQALQSTILQMSNESSRIWNTVEVYDEYLSHGGELLSRRMLLAKLTEHFGPDLLVLSGSGVASLLVFRSRTSSVLRLVAQQDDDVETELDKVAAYIVKESRKLARERNIYQRRVCIDEALNVVSPTMLSLLSKISDKLNRTKPAALIGNIITNIITNQPTTLQIALAVVLNRKSLIEDLYDFRVNCSYDEVLRFKSSAAVAAVKDSHIRGMEIASSGLVQVITDNFDATISSQNGLRSTHSLAMLLAMPEAKKPETAGDAAGIRRLAISEMKQPITEDLPIARYCGPKKPQMPAKESTRAVLPLKVLAHQVIQLSRAQFLDFKFFKAVVTDTDTPEFGGFNTKLAREQGQSAQPATRAIYTPLIDMTPADPDTMMTAMVEAQKLTKQCGQQFTVFTNDQQLYKVAVNVMWVYPEKFSLFVPRLGGMHMLMSFVGCVGVLMADSGLEDVLKSSFGSVSQMLAGKRFPQNVRALRLVVEELLRQFLQKASCYSDLMQALEDASSRSKTTELWCENLVKPVFIMMSFVRAEREGDWPLHLWAVKEMLPYFFAANHVNYARYGLYYLRSMEKLPKDILAHFMKGEHVMRHKPGVWNAIWSDMFIESTFMRYGHGPNGIVGITLKPSALQRWALSMHTCSQLVQDVADMTDGYKQSEVMVHKEEKPSRIRSDSQDRQNIQDKLKTCIDPLDPAGHPNGLVNIITGRVVPDIVNAGKSVEIGRLQMNEYQQSWPSGFNETLSKKVVTMSVTRKSLKVGTTPVMDTNIIYSRVLVLQHSRDINLKQVLQYELAPVPTSMFDDKGRMRISKSKSTLKRKLQVEKSSRLASNPDTTIVDGCAILWIIHWPNKGTVQDYVNKFVSFISTKTCQSDVYLVFDRYHDYSIKSGARQERAGQYASRCHQLSLQTPLPPQKVMLTVTRNKVQLIDIICEQLTSIYQQHHSDDEHRLVITGQNEVPVEVHRGIVINRTDLKTSQEEADVIIIHQLCELVANNPRCITVVCDDTDVFLLLVHHYAVQQMTCTVIMEGTSSGRAVVDIGETAKKHAAIVPQLLAVHAITGCDTVAQLPGIGKITAINTLLAGQSLKLLGRNSSQKDIVAECTQFIAACYGSKKRDMSQARIDVWSRKMAKPKLSKAPELKSLPPTTEAFEQNVRRAHIQTAIWKSANESDPPQLDPTEYGWTCDEAAKSLVPVMVPSEVKMAPPEVLELIRCGCSSSNPCSTARCSCSASKLPCTLFCTCHGEAVCRNQNNRDTDDADDGDDDDALENI